MTALSLPFSRRMAIWIAALSLGCALPAFAQRDGMPPQMAAPMGGPWHGAPGHAAERVDRLLDGLDIGAAERNRIRQIVQAAAADIAGERDAGRALRQQAMQAFTAPVVDAAAAEQLRQQMIAQHDRISRRRLQALLEISALLTPEQRIAVAQRMERRGAAMHERGMRRPPPAPARP